MRNLDRHLLLLEVTIQTLSQMLRLRVETFLKLWTTVLDVIQRRPRSSHHQRMFEERADEERGLGTRIRGIAVLPHAAVDRIHELLFAGDDSDRHAGARGFAVSDEIGLNVEEHLRATGK
jgi:hypothetical protein